MPDYGGLDFDSLFGAEPQDFARAIAQNDAPVYEEQRGKLIHDMRHGWHPYYDHPDELDRPVECERVRMRWQIFPICNAFHEIALDRNRGASQTYDRKFLG
jgi:hypothetical protein